MYPPRDRNERRDRRPRGEGAKRPLKIHVTEPRPLPRELRMFYAPDPPRNLPHRYPRRAIDWNDHRTNAIHVSLGMLKPEWPFRVEMVAPREGWAHSIDCVVDQSYSTRGRIVQFGASFSAVDAGVMPRANVNPLKRETLSMPGAEFTPGANWNGDRLTPPIEVEDVTVRLTLLLGRWIIQPKFETILGLFRVDPAQGNLLTYMRVMRDNTMLELKYSASRDVWYVPGGTEELNVCFYSIMHEIRPHARYNLDGRPPVALDAEVIQRR